VRLAHAIAAEHRAIVAAHRSMPEHWFRAGDFLRAAKDLIKGDDKLWLPFLRLVKALAGPGFSVRMSQNFMMLAANKDFVLAQAQRVAHYSLRRALRDIHRRNQDERDQARRAALVARPLPARCDIRHARMEDLLPTLKDVDAIICDPPWAPEFLPLYGELAKLAKQALKPRGTLVVLVPKHILDDVLAQTRPHMRCVTQLAYLMEGRQRTQAWSGKTNSSWNQVLVFGNMKNWGSDRIHVPPADPDQKAYHRHGQSVDGFRQIVERVTDVGDLVCDPFVGGGATALACYGTDRKFVGGDKDADAAEVARRRVAEEHYRATGGDQPGPSTTELPEADPSPADPDEAA
jgi:hypothetical protein